MGWYQSSGTSINVLGLFLATGACTVLLSPRLPSITGKVWDSIWLLAVLFSLSDFGNTLNGSWKWCFPSSL